MEFQMAGRAAYDALVGAAEAALILRVTSVTVRNRLKSGRLVASGADKRGRPLFSTMYLKKLSVSSDLKATGKNADGRLNLRGSKTGTSKNDRRLLVNERAVLSLVRTSLRHGALYKCAALFESALNLMCLGGLMVNTSPRPNESCISAWARGAMERNATFDELLGALVSNYRADRLCECSLKLPELKFCPEDGANMLGELYAELSDNPARSSFKLTPKHICDAITADLGNENDIFFDPCCGCGNFILSLIRRGVSPYSVYGFDTDPLAVKILRVNMALATGITDKSYYTRHFRAADCLDKARLPSFSVVLGNPLYAYKIREKEDRRDGSSFISSLLQKLLEALPGHGIARLILPDDLLNAKGYEELRNITRNLTTVTSARFMEGLNGSSGLSAVCLTFEKDKSAATVRQGIRVSTRERSFVIKRMMSGTDFSFDTDDEESALIARIEGIKSFILKDRAKFAMGIVTGNNRALIKNSQENGARVVLRGSCVSAFKIKERGEYTVFDRDSFQQSPELEMFERPYKILYRFVSDSPVAAVDTLGRLTLNSCNFIIPDGDERLCRYITALLNSKVMRFYFKKHFKVSKILRSQLEILPLADVSPERMDEVIKLSSRYYEEVAGEEFERAVARLYSLDESACRLIGKTLSGGNNARSKAG